MIRYIEKNKFLFFLALVINLISCLSPLFFAYIMENISGIFFNGDISKIYISLILIIVLMIYKFIFSYLNSKYKAKYRKKLREDLSKDIYASILNQDYVGFRKSTIGSYLSLFTNDVKMVDENYFFPFLSMITQCCLFICICLYLIHIDWTTFFMMCLLAIFTFLVPRLFSKILKHSSDQLSHQSQNYNAILKEIFQCFNIIKDYNSQEQYVEKGKKIINDFENKFYKFNFSIYLNTAYSNVVALIGQMLLSLALAVLVLNGNFKATYYMSVLTISNNFVDCLYNMASYYGDFISVKGINEKLIKFINKKETTRNITLFNNQHCIEFDHVYFSFLKNQPLFCDFSYRFEKGKKYAIVGDSGSGKSTILKLILGYYFVQKGKIKTFEKYPIIIHQDGHLFSGTLRENLCLGKEFSNEKIKDALSFANLSDWDLDKFISEDACNLSGGQIQRISIARGKLHCNSLLLCDEITSSLDNINSEVIEDNIINLEDVTVLYVTHKINEKFLKRCDEILVISNGKLIEHGNFDELLCNKNYFYHLLR